MNSTIESAVLLLTVQPTDGFLLRTSGNASANSTFLPPRITFNKFASPFDRGGSLYWFTVLSFLISVLLVFVGIIGNVFIITTVRSKRCQFSSHGIHLSALAIADIKSLLVALVNKRFVWNVFGTDIRGMTVAGCRAFLFSARVTKLGSIFFVVLVCVERFIAVWFPLRARLLTTQRTSYITVIAIFAIIYTLSISSSFFGVLKYGKCIADVVEGDPNGSKALTSAALFLSTVIPTVVLVCLTPLTVIRLSYQRAERKRLGTMSGKDETYRTTIMLISISVTYLLLVTSFAGTLWILKLSGVNVFITPDPWAGIFVEIMVTCDNLNCALNFILYGFFSPRFRRDFFTIMKCKRRSNAIGPSS